MTSRTTRRAALTTFGAGAAGLAALSMLAPAQAAMSSAAGIVAGGSVADPVAGVQFSAFGSRITLDDVSEPVLLGALAWYDPAGAAGGELRLSLVKVSSYGPAEDDEQARVLTGTVAVNGNGEHPFVLRLVDRGNVGAATDSVHLSVGTAAGEVSATPVADTGFTYELSGDLTTGDVQIITFP